MASLLTLSDIIALPQGTKAQIDAKVRALLSNNMIQKDPQGDPALRAMDEEEFASIGWDGSMASFQSITKKKMLQVLEKLIQEANEAQVAQQDAQIDNYMGNVPADAFGNANLGPAVSMNGNQAVFDDFSLGTSALPHPSDPTLTVSKIKKALRQRGIQIPKNITKKAQLLELYKTHYPPSPQYSPQSPPMMGMDGSSSSSSSSGMSKEGVGSSSKSSGSSSSGINLSANVPAIEINSQPTSTEITREYANIGRQKLNTVFQRMVQGAAIQGRGSLNQRPRYNAMMAEATQRLSAATNFFETNKKVFYLFTGRINVGAGRSIALRIAPGAGNPQLSVVTRTSNTCSWIYFFCCC